MLRYFIAIVTVLTSAVGFAQDTQAYKKRMCNDLEIIKNTFEVGYAPAEWKKTFAQWDLDQAISKAQVTVLAKDPLYVKDYQKIVKKFFQSTLDHHVNVRFCKNAAAFLPFRIASAEGRYFISWVDPNLPSELLQVGDEVTEFNGRSIDKVVQEFKKEEYGNESAKTIQMLAEIFFTCRLASLAHTIPSSQESVELSIMRRNTPLKVEGQWLVFPEEVSDGFLELSKKVTHPFTENRSSFYNREMVAGFYAPLKEAYQKRFSKLDNEPEMPIGALKSTLPPLGEVIWRSTDTPDFDAYIFKTPKGENVGFVRISTYTPASNPSAATEQFSMLIKRFEAMCSALVIDQQNNPGGLIFYMYALAAMLSDQPMQLPTHRMTITQANAFHALMEIEYLNHPENDLESEIWGYPCDDALVQNLVNHYKFIIKEWNAGRCFTQPNHLYGIEKLAVHPWGTFNKPILFIVNELDFSCADFLPAILQDNKRATICGTTTAGAGGYILGHSFPNKFGISHFSYTGSIIERLDKSVIENLGITPDVVCELTAKDLSHNYVDFKTKLLSVLDTILELSDESMGPKPMDESHYERPIKN